MNQKQKSGQTSEKSSSVDGTKSHERPTQQKVIITCALTGVLTNPKTHRVPVTPKEMAQSAREAHNAGASVVHCHFRMQEDGRSHLPCWDPRVAKDIVDAIRTETPDLIINCSTGIVGPDISGPLACLESTRPEMAALNCGSLNYLKVRENGEWAWPPMLFDNPVEKITKYLEFMRTHSIVPECECFDTGIVRSLSMFRKNGLLDAKAFVSFVMGIASGMPAKPSWLPLLVDELDAGSHWQVIAIGREEVWTLLERAIELGGHIRTGLEDHFYLPNGEKTFSNGQLVEAAASLVHQKGYEVATPNEVRNLLS